MEQSINNTAVGGVLEPISLELFFEQFWEQKPLHIERTTVNPFAQLVSIEKIESLLSTNSLSSQLVQLSHAGKRIAIDDYTDENDHIVANRIIEGYKMGNTIIMSQAQRLVPALMDLCRDVQSSLLMRCQTNLYLSPPGNQGFNPHYDTHDVFILQVSGTKQFNFYSKRAAHPTAADRFDKDIHAVGEKTQSISLSAGDTLYIPRGVVHDAVADTMAPSLHITLGVYPILLYTLLEEVLQDAAASDARLRRSLSQPLWMLGQGIEKTTQLLHDVLTANVDDEGISKALRRLRDDIALDSRKDVNGLLSTAQYHNDTTTTKLNTDTIATAVLKLNHRAILHIERSGNEVLLRTFGQVVELPDPFGKALEGLMGQGSFKLRDIKGLNAEQLPTFIQTLQSVDILAFD